MHLKFWSVAPIAAGSPYPSSGLQVCTYSVWRVFYRTKKNKQSPCYKLSQLQGVSPGHAVLQMKKGFILGKLKSISAVKLFAHTGCSSVSTDTAACPHLPMG